MAQDVALWGVAYTDVPEVRVPKQGGGMAAFHDVSDTTAVAADVAQGKLFHAADGTLTEGTASGGGGEEKAIQIRYGQGTGYPGATYTNSKLSINVKKTGYYDVMCSCARSYNSGSCGVQIYVNDSPVGTAHTSFIANNAYAMLVKESGIHLYAGDVVVPYYKSQSTSRSITVFNLIIQEV